MEIPVRFTRGDHKFILLEVGVKSVNTGVVISNELDNQIFEVSHSDVWKITIC